MNGTGFLVSSFRFLVRRSQHALWRARATALLLLSAITLALPACQAAPNTDDTLAELPRLSEVQSRVTPDGPPPEAQLTRGPRAQMLLQQFELAFDAPLTSVWAQVDETAIDAQTRALWEANGLRVGVVERSALGELFQQMPTVLSSGRRRVITDDYPTPLRASSRLVEPVRVALEAASKPVSESTEHAESAEGGRMRLLARARPRGYAGVAMVVAPQHHQPRLTLEPRDPRADVLDGRIYEKLALRTTLGANDVLVIGLWRDEAERETDQAAEEEDEPVSQGDGETVDDQASEDDRAEAEVEKDPAALPPHVGRAVMTVERGSARRQVLLLIAAQPFRQAQLPRDRSGDGLAAATIR